MSKLFLPAPEVALVADPIIEAHHAHLLMHRVRIEYVFCTEITAKNGMQIWGTARKISSLASFLKRADEIEWQPGPSDEELAAIEDDDARADATIERLEARERAEESGNAPFFVITIAQPIWELLDEAGRAALVDHELMHCDALWDKDGKTKLAIKAHDFEGFNAEIERHGIWRHNAVGMARAMQNAQMTFSFDAQPAETKPAEGSNKEEVSVTLSSGNKSVTLTDADFAEIADSLNQEPRRRGRSRKNPDAVVIAPM